MIISIYYLCKRDQSPLDINQMQLIATPEELKQLREGWDGAGVAVPEVTTGVCI